MCVCRILSFYGRFLRLFVLFGRNFIRLCIKKRAAAVLLHSRRALQASPLGEAVRFACRRFKASPLGEAVRFACRRFKASPWGEAVRFAD